VPLSTQDEDEWSPLSLCESYAEKRGYRVAKVGRPDAHRAGREIIQVLLSSFRREYGGYRHRPPHLSLLSCVQHCADGVLLLAFDPPPL
jgi:ribosome biogenesis GTPase A